MPRYRFDQPEEHGREQEKEETFLDEERGSYLFEKEEIEEINKDLRSMRQDPYGIGMIAQPAYYYPTKADEALDKTMLNMAEDSLKHDEKTFLTSDITINDKSIILEDMSKQNEEFRNKVIKETDSLNKELSNQKGLSKLWTIPEKLGIDPEASIDEESAFTKLAECPREPEESEYNRLRSKSRARNEVDPVFRITCPVCGGKKHIKLLFLKLKCFRCKGWGSVQTDCKTYYASQNLQKPMTWRERYWKEYHEETNSERVQLDESLHIVMKDGFGQHSHPYFYSN